MEPKFGRSGHRPGHPSERNESNSLRLPSLLDEPQSKVTHTNKNSMLNTDFDRKMASRQPHINSLPPSQRKAQEKWAQEQLKQMPRACVAGFSYTRVAAGYVCRNNICFISDDLLAEGEGGYYTLCVAMAQQSRSRSREKRSMHGPFYPSDENDVPMFGSGARGGNAQSRFGGCAECWGLWSRQIWRKRISLNGTVF
jgi:hypothetical protein